MTSVKCPQCGKFEVATYSNGILVTHEDESGAECRGSLNHPKSLPLKDGEKPPYRYVPGLHAKFNP